MVCYTDSVTDFYVDGTAFDAKKGMISSWPGDTIPTECELLPLSSAAHGLVSQHYSSIAAQVLKSDTGLTCHDPTCCTSIIPVTYFWADCAAMSSKCTIAR